MKKTLLTIAFTTATLFANAFESRLFSVDFDKKELHQNGHKYELVEVSKVKQAGGQIVTFECVDEEIHEVSFKLTVSEKGLFVKFQKSELEEE